MGSTGIMGIYWGHIGRMENKTETTMIVEADALLFPLCMRFFFEVLWGHVVYTEIIALSWVL